MLNGLFHCYQLDQSIAVLRVVGWPFQFYSSFDRTFCKEIVVLRRLIWVCTVCICPTKRTIGLYGLILYDHRVDCRLNEI